MVLEFWIGVNGGLDRGGMFLVSGPGSSFRQKV